MIRQAINRTVLLVFVGVASPTSAATLADLVGMPAASIISGKLEFYDFEWS